MGGVVPAIVRLTRYVVSGVRRPVNTPDNLLQSVSLSCASGRGLSRALNLSCLEARSRAGAMAKQITADDVKRLVAARAFIDREFRRAPMLDEIARAARLSRYHFHRLFRRHFGQTPKHYLAELRIKEAQRLLLGGMRSAEAARRLGFSQAAHLVGWFKRLVGKTPRKWLKGVRDKR
jgi:AraC-like DNA-binding protein